MHISISLMTSMRKLVVMRVLTHDALTTAKASGSAVAPCNTSTLVIPQSETAVSTYSSIHIIMLDEIELGRSF
jgi:hypothetical protein